MNRNKDIFYEHVNVFNGHREKATEKHDDDDEN